MQTNDCVLVYLMFSILSVFVLYVRL